MSLALVTLSHSPLMGRHQPAADVVAAVDEALADARSFVAEFAPEVVLLVAPDHYNGMFYDLMPPFCVGTAARSIGDYGTAEGPLPVHRELSEAVLRHALDRDIDLAHSERMVVDHGFAQPLEILFGSIDAVQVVPVFVNSVAVPLGPGRRARMLGRAIGEVLRDRSERVLVLGSGGLSHDPPLPRLADAPAEVAEALIAGRNPSASAREGREARVLDAGRAMTAGTAPVLDLNPDWDLSFIELLRSGRVEAFDRWSTEQVAAQAGNSAHEVRTWVLAYAALAAAGQYEVRSTFYRPIPEWIAGFGVTTALPVANGV
ncbi:3-carboxyethylcatechol 2,3-dioxygenase [Pseudonocardia nematodicida]|uniref:2,3-dihydroxyphenylpropionate/2,3-dihydroxicinnamic acid 1,2-dioxygenase n=1 Tax=Pseudonocardia nematodicida TaxID=1206997 RepID=A0ABV1K6K4_9PSEU